MKSFPKRICTLDFESLCNSFKLNARNRESNSDNVKAAFQQTDRRNGSFCTSLSVDGRHFHSIFKNGKVCRNVIPVKGGEHMDIWRILKNETFCVNYTHTEILKPRNWTVLAQESDCFDYGPYLKQQIF